MYTQHHENFNSLFFESGDFNISYKQFSQNFLRIVKYFEKVNKQKSSLKTKFWKLFPLKDRPT